MTDAELERIEREAQINGYRLAEVDRAMQHRSGPRRLRT